jgi:hypothetical protein
MRRDVLENNGACWFPCYTVELTQATRRRTNSTPVDAQVAVRITVPFRQGVTRDTRGHYLLEFTDENLP